MSSDKSLIRSKFYNKDLEFKKDSNSDKLPFLLTLDGSITRIPTISQNLQGINKHYEKVIVSEKCKESIKFVMSDETIIYVSHEQEIPVFKNDHIELIRAKQLVNTKGYKLSTGEIKFVKKSVPINSFVFGYWLGNQITELSNDIKELNQIYINNRNVKTTIWNIYPCMEKLVDLKNVYKLDSELHFVECLHSLGLFDRKKCNGYSMFKVNFFIPNMYKHNYNMDLLLGLENFFGINNKDKFIIKIPKYAQSIIDDIIFIYRTNGFRARKNFKRNVCTGIYVNKSKPPLYSFKCSYSNKESVYIKTNNKNAFLTSDLFLI